MIFLQTIDMEKSNPEKEQEENFEYKGQVKGWNKTA